jgi:integrase
MQGSKKGAKKIDNKLNFIKSAIENLPIPRADEYGKVQNLVFRDAKQQGLCLIVSYGGSKTFYLSKKINGITQRIKLGKFPEISIEEARKLALQNLNIINQGKNPNEEKRKINKEMTFKELFDEFMVKYAIRNNKQSTIKEYKRSFEMYLSFFKNKKISQISKSDIEKFHNKIGENNGKYIANRQLGYVKVFYNKAIEWGFEGKNPAISIKPFKENSRDRYLKPEEIPLFFKSLEEEPNFLFKNYFYIALFTGARKDNILSMKWQDIDFTLAEWRIPETKNGEIVKIPLSQEVIEILQELKKYQENLKINSSYVFYSKNSKSNHLEEPKSAWKRILTKANIKDLRIHDLRRTLGSYQAMSGSSLQVIGKSLGHKSIQATQIYSRMNLDPVRESVKKATERILGFRDKK